MAFWFPKYYIHTLVSKRLTDMKNLFLFGLILAGFSNCQHQETEQSTPKIDSLAQVLTGYEKTFAEIDTAKIASMMEGINTSIDTAAAICKSKKLQISKEESTVFGRFSALRTGLRKYNQRYSDMQQELVYTKKQLSALKSNMNLHKLDAEAEQKYYNDEVAAVKNLGNAVEQFHGTAVFAYSNYQTYQPKIDSLIASFGKRTK